MCKDFRNPPLGRWVEAVSSSIKTTKVVVRWLLREPVLPSLGMGTWWAGIRPPFRKSKCERQSGYEPQEQRYSERRWKHTVLAPPALKTRVVPEALLRTTRESLELSEAELWPESHKPWRSKGRTKKNLYRAAVPNLYGDRVWFRRRQFFDWPGQGMFWGWFKCIIFIMHFIVITSALPQIIRH